MFIYIQSEEILHDLDDQLESLRENIKYVQENINECQSNIMQMEEENKVRSKGDCVELFCFGSFM